MENKIFNKDTYLNKWALVEGAAALEAEILGKYHMTAL